MSESLLPPCSSAGCRRRGKVRHGSHAYCGDCAISLDLFASSSTVVVTPDPVDRSADGRVVRLSSSSWLVASKTRSCYWPVERDADGIHCGCEKGVENERYFGGVTLDASPCEHARTAVAYEISRDRAAHPRPSYAPNVSALVD